MSTRKIGMGSVALALGALIGGCGTSGTTADVTSLLSSLTGTTVTDSTPIGDILNQLTVGQLVAAYEAYVATRTSGTTNSSLKTALTSDDISQIEDLQAQLDAGTIDQATFDSELAAITSAAGIGHAGCLGGPTGLGLGKGTIDALNLTADQVTAAEAIFTQLKTDIQTLRTTAKQQILDLLTADQQAILANIGLDKVSTADRGFGEGGQGGPEGHGGGHGHGGPGHHGSMGLGSSSAADSTYLDLLATKLTLTDEQKASIQTILTDLETAIQAAHDQAETDFRALLTADQLATLDALQAAAGTTSDSTTQ